MMRIVLQILEDIKQGENIELIVTVALALIVSILDCLGIVTKELVASVTLATLGLIAVGLLITRYRVEDIYRKEDTRNTVRFQLQKPASLEHTIANSKEIWMVGLTLRTTTIENFYTFQRIVRKGARLRTLIVNPSKIDMDMVARRFSRAATAENFRADFAQTVNQYKEIHRSANNADNVQLKLLGFVPSFSLYIFPKAEDGGIIYADVYCYKSPLGSVPRFRVTERENPEWYRHFTGQFELMWQDAETVALECRGV